MNTHYHTRYHTQTIAHAHYHKQIIAHSLNFAHTPNLLNCKVTLLHTHTHNHTLTLAHTTNKTIIWVPCSISSLTEIMRQKWVPSMSLWLFTSMVQISVTWAFLALPTETCLRSFSEEEGSFFALKVDFEANQPQNKHLSLKTSHCWISFKFGGIRHVWYLIYGMA